MSNTDSQMELHGMTTVCELLEQHPRAYRILRKHGLPARFRKTPPHVPLAAFAHKHCDGNVDALLNQIRASVGQ